MDYCLQHYGIQGQKWGMRRFQNSDGTLTEEGKRRYASNYSSEQRKRDKSVYGPGAVRRINKRMLNGESVSSSRSREAERIQRFRDAGRITRQIGGVAGGIGGFLASKAINKTLSRKISGLDDPAVSILITGGVVAAGTQIGKYGGEALTMIAGGYRPSKYR